MLYTALLLTSCYTAKKPTEITSLQKPHKPHIEGYVFKEILPIVDTVIDNVWLVSRNRPIVSRIYYYNNQTLLQSGYIPHKVIGTETILELYSDERRYGNLIFSDTAKHCVYADSSRFFGYRLINKDSSLKRETAFSDAVDKILEQINYKEISSGYDANGFTVKTFRCTNIKDTLRTGRVTCTFAKQPSDYSRYVLSPIMEKETGLKLIKIIISTDPWFYKEKNANIGRLELSYEIEKITVGNTEELMKLFELERIVNKNN